VKLFDCKNNYQSINFQVSTSGIRFIAIDKQEAFLAAAGDDKIIKIYNLNKPDKNPVVISNIQSKILSIEFHQSKLYVFTEDNSVLYFENEFATYAAMIKNKLLRNFTQDEWNTFIGEKFPYEKTK